MRKVKSFNLSILPPSYSVLGCIVYKLIMLLEYGEDTMFEIQKFMKARILNLWMGYWRKDTVVQRNVLWWPKRDISIQQIWWRGRHLGQNEEMMKNLK